MSPSSCPFCSVDAERVIFDDGVVRALWDAFPLNAGHALIAPLRHVASWFDATDAERASLVSGISAARAAIVTRHHADGFNIGINDGAAAGQTIAHLHVHVIPRIVGDVPDPRGGVRWVVPSRAPYWTFAKEGRRG